MWPKGSNPGEGDCGLFQEDAYYTKRIHFKGKTMHFYQIKDKKVFLGGFGAFCLDYDVCCCSTGLKNLFKRKSNTVSSTYLNTAPQSQDQKSTCQSEVSESPSSHSLLILSSFTVNKCQRKNMWFDWFVMLAGRVIIYK